MITAEDTLDVMAVEATLRRTALSRTDLYRMRKIVNDSSPMTATGVIRWLNRPRR